MILLLNNINIRGQIFVVFLSLRSAHLRTALETNFMAVVVRSTICAWIVLQPNLKTRFWPTNIFPFRCFAAISTVAINNPESGVQRCFYGVEKQKKKQKNIGWFRLPISILFDIYLYVQRGVESRWMLFAGFPVAPLIGNIFFLFHGKSSPPKWRRVS